MNECGICDAKRRKIDRNGHCRACNFDLGIKQCARCRDILPITLSYYLWNPEPGVLRASSRCITCIGLGRRKGKRRGRPSIVQTKHFEQAKQMYEQGWSLRLISQLQGVSLSALNRVFRANGVAMRPGRPRKTTWVG